MALIKDYADFLVAARRQGACFDRVVTLGRLQNNLTCAPELQGRTDPVLADRYVDTFFRTVLGTVELDALDYSAYEGANLVHDLNQPLPPARHEQYDVAVDAGTLEHVFDLPAALRNTMLLPRVGGSLFLLPPANNLFGHGFYQFSPDLFFRVLSPANGYRIAKMAIMESHFIDIERGMRPQRYAVLDPAARGGRSIMVSRFPAVLFVHAIKLGPTPERLTALQSDYVATWNQAAAPQPAATSSAATPPPRPPPPGPSGFKALGRRLAALLPPAWEQALRSRYEAARFYSLDTHPCFAPAPADYFDGGWTSTLGR